MTVYLANRVGTTKGAEMEGSREGVCVRARAWFEGVCVCVCVHARTRSAAEARLSVSAALAVGRHVGTPWSALFMWN